MSRKLFVTFLVLFFNAQLAIAQESCVEFDYFEGKFKKVKKVLKEKKADRGVVSGFKVDLNSKRRNFAYRYRSKLKIDHAGDYIFSLWATNLSRLRIGGKRVVAHKRRHSGSERTGTVYLEKGYHDLELIYVLRRKKEKPVLQYLGPDTDGANAELLKISCGVPEVLSPAQIKGVFGTNSFFRALNDGTLDPGEECDDGNAINGDGCDSAGNLEAGYICNLEVRCGDGALDYPEVCDDNNVTSRDGCSPTCGKEVSLTNFINESHQFDMTSVVTPVWNVSADGYSVNLPNTVNPKVGFYLSDKGMFDDGPVFSLSTIFTNDDDDDYLGFVFGFNPGEFANDAADYIVLAWKDGDQNFDFGTNPVDIACPGGLAPAGLRMFRVNGVIGADEFWQLSDCPASTGDINVIATSSIYPNTGYEASSFPVIKVVYTPSRIQVYLDDVLDINVTGSFPSNGKYGLYAFAQQGVTYEPVNSPPIQISSCIAVCGDGLIVGAETCDDGNLIDGDGCSSFCQFEGGYVCTGTPSSCNSSCGDGVVAQAEQCDDGNMTAGDGCDDTLAGNCQIESGYSCSGSPSTCSLTCGNGAIDSGEECDDNNNTDGDGCSAVCRIEVTASTNIKFSSASQTVVEGVTTLTVDVQLDQFQDADLIVPIEIDASSTASDVFDYENIPSSVTIPFGLLSATVSIDLLDDPYLESDETIILNFGSGLTVNADTPDQHVITITDNDSATTNSCLNYEYYQGTYSNLDQMLATPVVNTGQTNDFNITIEGTTDLFGYVYTSELEITTAGNYIFSTRSDDGSRLYINGALIVDNDGLHGPETETGNIALPVGFYEIRVEFFERTGGQILEVEYDGPGFGSIPIPGSVLNCIAPAATVQFSEATYNFLENTGTVNVELELSSALTYDLDVPVNVLGSSTASDPADYTVSSPIFVTFPAGSTTASFPVILIDNPDIESPNKQIDFELGVTQNGASGLQTTSSLVIIDDDSASPVTQTPNCIAYEYFTGNFAPSVDNFPATPVEQGCIDSYDITVGGAVNRFGYRFTSQILITQPGSYTFYTNSDDGSKLFINGGLVVDNDGDHAENEESGSVTLAAGFHDIVVEMYENQGEEVLDVSYEGPGISKRLIPSNILYCDIPVVGYQTTSQSVSETAGTIAVNIETSAAGSCPITLPYSLDVSGSTATSGDDFNISGSSLTIPVGDTTASFNVSIVNDPDIEIDETISIDLGNPDFAVLGVNDNHVITIIDDDSVPPTVSIAVSPAMVDENSGADATVTAALSNITGVDVTVNLNFSGDADSSDYTPAANSIVIPAGSLANSIVLDVQDDCPDEDDEDIDVSVSSIVNATASGPQSGSTTISDGNLVPYRNPTNFSGTISISTNYFDDNRYLPSSESTMTIAEFYENILGLSSADATIRANALQAAALSRFSNYFGVDLSSGPAGNWVLTDFVIPPSPAGYIVDRISGLRVGERGGDVYEVGYAMLAASDGAVLDGTWSDSVGFSDGLPAPQGVAAFYGEYHIQNLHVICDDGNDQTPEPSLVISYTSNEPTLGNAYDQVVYNNDILNISCTDCTLDISGTGRELSARQLTNNSDGTVQRYVNNVIKFDP